LELEGRLTTLPITLNARGLASLLAPCIDRSEVTILRDISRRPDSLPHPEKYGGAKKTWDTKVVLDWLPAGVRAAIIRQFVNKNGEIQKTNQPPRIKSIAVELELANSAAMSQKIASGAHGQQRRETSKNGSKKS